MIWIFGALTAMFFFDFVTGIALALYDRGQSERRKGPEVFQEIAEGQQARKDRYSSQRSSHRVVKTRGHGVSLSGTASYSWPEMIQAWRNKQWRLLLPVFLMASSIVGMPLFGGLTLTQTSDGTAQFFGLVLIGAAVFIGIKMARLARQASKEH